MRLGDFISHILDIVFPPRDTERRVREMRSSAFLMRMSPAIDGATNPSTTVLFSFTAPVRAVIHEAKYRRNKKALGMLGQALGEYLIEMGTLEGRLVMVPMPLSSARVRERGFNQCEEIAKAIPERDIPILPDALVRVKNTEHQTRLTRSARLENATGAFDTPCTLDPALTYIVLDDVITTGATMQSAIDTLRLAGAVHILPIALAH